MKVVGSLLIILSSIMASYFYEARQKEKVKTIGGIISLLLHIKSSIEYLSLPINDSLNTFKQYPYLVKRVINKEKITEISGKLSEELDNCLNMLGKSYKKEQIARLEYTISVFENELKICEGSIKQKSKVFKAISLFVGCCIVILLI
ncbi:MAG: hypothetical protein IJX02_04200 [Clostridia bacterium]|nr:hypothetical protein [Clostridia bacterium]